MSKIILESINDFDLEQTFECGQCFRWEKESDGSYTGVANNKVINISSAGSNIIIENSSIEDFDGFWHDYFDLGTDYAQIKAKLVAQDEIIKDAIDKGYGIRILRQDIWETICSFIISANNNIPRIKGCIEKLCNLFGASLGTYKGKEYFGFPKPEVIANLTIDDLASVRVGYRARYLIDSAKMFVNKGEAFFRMLASDNVSYEEAFKEITALSGVGPKVANCILLFALQKRKAFPIDVWMKKVMHELYGFDEDDIIGMQDFAEEKFAESAGIAQQYLFYYVKTHLHIN